MPFKLKHNKNYAYLFFIIVGVTIFSVLIFKGNVPLMVLSLSFYCLGFLQLYSGVALSSTWTAKYTREDKPLIFWVLIVLSFAAGTSILTMFL